MAINLNALTNLFASKAPQQDEVETLVKSFEEVKSLPAFKAVKDNLRDKIEIERQAQNDEAKALAKLSQVEQAEQMMGVILRRNKQAQVNTIAAKESEKEAIALANKVAKDVKTLMSLMDEDLTQVDLDLLLGTTQAPATKTQNGSNLPDPGTAI